MPYANLADKRACLIRRKARAKAFVGGIRASTFCEHCGGQPIDWHRKEHEMKPYRRIARMAARGQSLVGIAEEIRLCQALCRRCHMQIDGRLEVFLRIAKARKGKLQGLRQCSTCERSERYLRKGRCNRCDRRRRSKLTSAA